MTLITGLASAVAPLISRIIAAIFGGYALAALTSVSAVALLPIEPVQAVLAGMLLSFVVYASSVIWVFAVRSATRAWAGLAIAATPLGLAAWAVWSAGGGV